MAIAVAVSLLMLISEGSLKEDLEPGMASPSFGFWVCGIQWDAAVGVGWMAPLQAFALLLWALKRLLLLAPLLVYALTWYLGQGSSMGILFPPPQGHHAGWQRLWSVPRPTTKHHK